MDATTIVLPSTPGAAPRPGLPILAAIVPVVAGVVLWLITGSLFALAFAAVGPLMLAASFVDGIRNRRRQRRQLEAEADKAWERADDELLQLHSAERAELWRQHPDTIACLLEPPLRGHDPIDHDTPLVIGRGGRKSSVRTTGGDDERAQLFRHQAETVTDAPVTVALGGGVCVRAGQSVRGAIVRALVAQLCLRFRPAQLNISGDAESFGLADFPHTVRAPSTFRLAIGEGDDGAQTRICVRDPGDEPPDGVTTIVDVDAALGAKVRTPQGVFEVECEALSSAQAAAVAALCARRAISAATVPQAIGLNELPQLPDGIGLPATIGRGAGGDAMVDLVEDGPHAIVTGMTGTGKSELLTTWVTAMAAVRRPDQVSFVLVDFKGGTAFEPLQTLPHVVAVVTDLDGDGARRGVSSLSAELRRREARMAAAGARDVQDCPELGRLVIVVDEFAALLHDHPDLGTVFTDIAARGRALGMHLVIGTQRASGVIREALAANCPLRISLRVTDGADSRLVVGSTAAAQLPGGPEGRGLAYLRRPRDAEAQQLRVALTRTADLEAIAKHQRGLSVPPSPWLPPLPSVLPLADMPELPAEASVLGLADDPSHQDQHPIMLPAGTGLAVVGGPGAGKSALVRLLAAQNSGAVIVPNDLEAAWDAVIQADHNAEQPILCDDLDLLLAGFPPEYAHVFLARWETIARARRTTVVTMSRASGPLGRLMDSLPRRLLLRMPSRIEHVAAGGESGDFDRGRPPGRARWDTQDVQLCWTDAPLPHIDAAVTPTWRPGADLAGVVTTAVAETMRRLREAPGPPAARGRRDAGGGRPLHCRSRPRAVAQPMGTHPAGSRGGRVGGHDGVSGGAAPVGGGTRSSTICAPARGQSLGHRAGITAPPRPHLRRRAVAMPASVGLYLRRNPDGAHRRPPAQDGQVQRARESGDILVTKGPGTAEERRSDQGRRPAAAVEHLQRHGRPVGRRHDHHTLRAVLGEHAQRLDGDGVRLARARDRPRVLADRANEGASHSVQCERRTV